MLVKLRTFYLILDRMGKNEKYCWVVIAIPVKPAIHGSKFSRDRLNFHPCMGREIVEKSIYCREVNVY